MIWDITIIALGFFFLWKGSEYFVTAAAEIARRIGVSDLVIGLTLVSASTTLPEFMASVMASHLGSGGICVGNAVGSNITNIALILGICMILEGYRVEPVVLKRYGAVLLLVCCLFVVFCLGGVSRLEGGLLLTLFFVYLFVLSREKHTRREMVEVSIELRDIHREPVWKILVKFVGGGAAIFIGARYLVQSALNIAAALQVQESAIGATIVALGTSLPEFAVALRALKEDFEEISVGNILGANTFNILWVVGVSALVRPLALDSNLLYFNIPMMMGVTLLLLGFMSRGYQLRRWQGMLFVGLYLLFVITNFV
ncbi:MAG: calcium/sodium antiporter [Theionarchaea archaeon]|nr:calcium/sodium antiporter [Theionarchaea archaeon]MBU7037713.1 calcium/sodium antiporter [Theionarchaea archaeon]